MLSFVRVVCQSRNSLTGLVFTLSGRPWTASWGVLLYAATTSLRSSAHSDPSLTSSANLFLSVWIALSMTAKRFVSFLSPLVRCVIPLVHQLVHVFFEFVPRLGREEPYGRHCLQHRLHDAGDGQGRLLPAAPKLLENTSWITRTTEKPSEGLFL